MTKWPALAFDDWEATCDTLHMWSQIVGKTRLALTPLENHWWNVPLYVTSCGLTTSAIPFDGGIFEAQFDFQEHKLALRSSQGGVASVGLYARSVADFYREYMARLRELGVDVQIYKTPVEFDQPIPFDQDEQHASYDERSVEKFQQILIGADRAFKEFRARFIGKCSPVHFFWGSFDLAVTRFSGRPASLPDTADRITREAYSHEVSSCGFWPGDRRFKHAAFYSYAAPSPAGLKEKPIRPEAAHWDTQLGEFILKYDDARAAASPDQAILEFCQSTYEAAVGLAGWDRAALERAWGERA